MIYGIDYYISKVQNQSNARYYNLNKETRDSIEIKFSDWKQSSRKSEVDFYYNDPNFGLNYVRNLYAVRARCFLKLLEEFKNNNRLREIIIGKSTTNIMSICCGPGPEIIAIIHFIRKNLGFSDKRLKITGIDKLEYWRTYHQLIDGIDHNVRMRFESTQLTRSFLLNLPDNHFDICIMSYPQSMVFTDVWDVLKRKFQFILILDQSPNDLLNTVRKHGFTVSSFYDGLGCKQFFYWMNDNNKVNFEYLPSPEPQVSCEDSNVGQMILGAAICGAYLLYKLFK